MFTQAQNSITIIGKSPQMQLIFQRVKEAARTNVNILLIGESGTGKDLLAVTIHQQSKRVNGPFIPINMGAISSELVASELFGHQKGSFTGATSTKIGIFEQANNGTVFLDEISTMDEITQVSLLRVLETSKFQRIGGRRFIKTDIRIIAATNESLYNLEEIHQSAIREDLYHRLSVFTIHVPPLREREGDIQLLSKYYLDQSCKEFKKDIRGFDKKVMNIFKTYSWPGNVRELKNVIQRAVLITKGNLISSEHIPNRLLYDIDDNQSQEIKITIGKELKEVEKIVILKTIEYTKGNRTKAAKILGISRRALYNKLDA